MHATPAELIARLDFSETRGFPIAAIKEIISRKDEMTPHLIDILTDCLANPANYLDGSKSMQPTYASYLLAQFRETRGYRPIISLLSVEGNTADILFGDSLTEDMNNVIACVFDGDEAPLRSLIENPAAYEYARASAGLHAYQSLLLMGRITTGEVEKYFGELMEHKLERQNSMVWNNVTSISADLGLSSLLPLIHRAFQEDLCDPWFDSLEDIKVRIASGGSKRWKDSCEPIDDVVALMKSWACFNPYPSRRPPTPDFQLPALTSRTFSSIPVLPPAPKYPGVTRNDPCPCGSGKKFKKCCGAGS